MNKKVGLLALIPILYFSVSGGPFGLEELVSSVGPFYSLLLICLIPIVWSIPEALIVGELSSAFPLEGGYYKWVQMALGNFWGFIRGWWGILYTLTDLSLYPILVTTYLQLLFPDLNFWTLYFIQLLVIWGCALINIFGIRVVSEVLAVFQLFIFIIFAILIFYGFKFISFDFSPAFHNPPNIGLNGILLGLTLAFWNYIGLDNASSVLGEVENPKKNYFKGLLILVPVVAISYILPILIGVCVNQDWQNWNFGQYTFIARSMKIEWLAVALIYGGMVTFLGLFNSLILTSSRILSTMSEDGFLPKPFSAIDKKTNTPVFAIIFSAVMYSFLVLIGFNKLVVYDVFIFLLSMLLEVIALFVLRQKSLIKEADCRIPFGKIGLYVCVSLALFVIVLMSLLYIIYSFKSFNAFLVTLLFIFSGIPLYKLCVSIKHTKA